MKTNKSTLTKRQQIELLKTINNKLSYIFQSVHFGTIYKNYLQHNINGEQKYLKFKPCHIQHGLTKIEGGIYFAVKHLLEYYTKQSKKPSLKHYLSYLKTHFEAYSIYLNYKKQIKQALKKIDNWKEVFNIDYIFLVNTDKQGNLLNQ